ncbi:site-specific integrase [Nocardia sp. NPDC048505]|uniref:tyrosine-type recombinase/integrase n=1 Tax=unclassified Nocardia TaxID=2637762 RepID=UPI0034007F57
MDAAEAPMDLFAIEVAAGPLLTGFGALLGARPDLPPRARKLYRERVGHFLTWVRETGGFGDALHCARGRDRAVDAYLGAAVADRGVAGRTLELSLRALNAFYEWLGLGPPAVPRVLIAPADPRALELGERRAVLRAAAERGPRAYALLVFGLDLGVGTAELVTLDLAGLDLGKWPGQLGIPDQGGGSRTVPLSPVSRAAVAAWLPERRRILRGEEHRALFLTEQAPPRRLLQRTLEDAVRAIGRDAGVDLSPEALRATAEQKLLREGLAPEVVAGRLGGVVPSPAARRNEPGRKSLRGRPRVPVPGSEQLDLFGGPTG